MNSQGVVGLKRISFSVAKGEIVGITGVDGEGRRLLAEVIGGQKRTTAGKLHYRGRDITLSNIAQRFELGIRYVTDDRMNEGCVLDMALSENAILQSYYRQPFSQFGILNQGQRSIFYRGSDQPLWDTGNRTRCPDQYTEWRQYSEIHLGQKSVRWHRA